MCAAPGIGADGKIAVLPDEDECTITQRAKVLELLKPWVTLEEIDLERAAL